METKFESALNQHEITDFFKGNGIYFARGSDWGDHLYISNWQEMCSILKNEKAAQNLLTTIFEEYAKFLKETYTDAAGLLSNISSYYILKKKIPFLSLGNYDLIESLDEKTKKNIGMLFRLLRTTYDKKNANLSKYSFQEELNRIKNSGCPFVLEQF